MVRLSILRDSDKGAAWTNSIKLEALRMLTPHGDGPWRPRRPCTAPRGIKRFRRTSHCGSLSHGKWQRTGVRVQGCDRASLSLNLRVKVRQTRSASRGLWNLLT